MSSAIPDSPTPPVPATTLDLSGGAMESARAAILAAQARAAAQRTVSGSAPSGTLPGTEALPTIPAINIGGPDQR